MCKLQLTSRELLQSNLACLNHLELLSLNLRVPLNSWLVITAVNPLASFCICRQTLTEAKAIN